MQVDYVGVLARSGNAVNLKLHSARFFMERESCLFICVNGKNSLILFAHKNNYLVTTLKNIRVF